MKTAIEPGVAFEAGQLLDSLRDAHEGGERTTYNEALTSLIESLDCDKKMAEQLVDHWCDENDFNFPTPTIRARVAEPEEGDDDDEYEEDEGDGGFFDDDDELDQPGD